MLTNFDTVEYRGEIIPITEEIRQSDGGSWPIKRSRFAVLGVLATKSGLREVLCLC